MLGCILTLYLQEDDCSSLTCFSLHPRQSFQKLLKVYRKFSITLMAGKFVTIVAQKVTIIAAKDALQHFTAHKLANKRTGILSTSSSARNLDNQF